MLTFIVGLVACLIFPTIVIPGLIGFAVAGPVGGVVGAIGGVVLFS